ncbi:MAG: (Fe-S)-binding protein [Armatimonadetes bacterium]|nr:(Fe-S)-binding protein [Armatimonadota bacterium]
MVPTRSEFLHQSLPQKLAFYFLILGCCIYAGWRFFERAKVWRQGKPIDWKPSYLQNVVRYIAAQRKVRNARPRSGAPMHLFIFYGFLALLLATTLLGINTYSPIKFHQGTYYVVYEIVFDAMGLVFLVGITWAMVRRGAFRPKVLTQEWKDVWALALLFALGLTGYLVEAARISNHPQTWDASASWVGAALARGIPNISDGGYVAIWWIHALLVMAFIAALPHMRLKHIVMAVAASAGSPERKYGVLQPISLEEVEQTGQIGVAVAKEYSRWHLMSLDACMECGRCTEVCPANLVGKILNPKRVVQDIAGVAGTETPVAGAVSEEALWQCTTCNACVEACPVLIRHVDLIVDARRNLVAEGKLAGTGAVMLRQITSTSHAWGAQPGSREEWMKGMEVPLARDKKKFDVLFWVGCAGATDPGAMKTTRAVAELLLKAGIDFACLGNEEACTGDPARRIGDEFLFQEMAQQNVGRFGSYEFKTIVTPCPHCFNTLANEYGQFGGQYEVKHHSELLSELIAAGKLKSAKPSKGEVAYHDPCYLARINNQSDAPRALLGERTQLNEMGTEMERAYADTPDRRNLAEPEHYGRKTLCCGAGGGRMWMEEEPNQRPSENRARELVATGAKTVALGCPFCRIMLDASIKQVSEEEIKLIDLAEMVRDANA